MEAEASMSHGGNLFPRQLLPGQDSRQYQIKDSRFMIETAGRYAQYGNIAYG